jgi:hypothetical protein
LEEKKVGKFYIGFGGKEKKKTKTD